MPATGMLLLLGTRSGPVPIYAELRQFSVPTGVPTGQVNPPVGTPVGTGIRNASGKRSTQHKGIIFKWMELYVKPFLHN